jgi:tetratricopeptide (TPR) repeat protein
VQGDAALGVRLVAASAPLYFQLSLLPECIASTQRALSALDPTDQGTRLELELQVCFGVSRLFSREHVSARAAVDRGLQLAAELQDTGSELLLLHAAFTWWVRRGDCRGLAEIADRFTTTASKTGDPLAEVIAQVLTATARHHYGDVRGAIKLAQAALSSSVHLSKLNAASFVDIHNANNHSVLAKSLWLAGYLDQALVAAKESLRKALDTGNPRTIAPVLGWTTFIYLRAGEWETADALSDQLLAHATRYRLATYTPVGMGWQGSLAVLRGDCSRGIELLQRAIADLRAYDYGLYIRALSAALAEGHAKAGQYDLAYTTICDAVAWSEDHGPSVDLPELLRLKGEILFLRSSAEAEDCLLQALQLAQSQLLLSEEIRIAMSLARLWANDGTFAMGLELLTATRNRFTEGFGTRDLVASANLLRDLRSRSG